MDLHGGAMLGLEGKVAPGEQSEVVACRVRFEEEEIQRAVW